MEFLEVTFRFKNVMKRFLTLNEKYELSVLPEGKVNRFEVL